MLKKLKNFAALHGYVFTAMLILYPAIVTTSFLLAWAFL